MLSFLLLAATALTSAAPGATPFDTPIADADLAQVTSADPGQLIRGPAPDYAGPSLRILTGDQMDVWWGSEGAELIAEVWQPRSSFIVNSAQHMALNANGGVDLHISVPAGIVPIASGTPSR